MSRCCGVHCAPLMPPTSPALRRARLGSPGRRVPGPWLGARSAGMALTHGWWRHVPGVRVLGTWRHVVFPRSSVGTVHWWLWRRSRCRSRRRIVDRCCASIPARSFARASGRGRPRSGRRWPRGRSQSLQRAVRAARDKLDAVDLAAPAQGVDGELVSGAPALSADVLSAAPGVDKCFT